MMHTKKELCEKIISIYPDIGECGIDVDVELDDKNNFYVVDLKKGTRELKHHLAPKDADMCMDGKQCVGLGLDIAQLKKNVDGKQF